MTFLVVRRRNGWTPGLRDLSSFALAAWGETSDIHSISLRAWTVVVTVALKMFCALESVVGRLTSIPQRKCQGCQEQLEIQR